MTVQEMLDEIDDYEAREERALLLNRGRLMEHRHCADEGHPGCSQCCDEGEGEQ